MVKICGITKEADIEAAVDAGVDMLGFVVGVPSSPRNIPISKVKNLINKVPRSVDSVAVTVFKTMDELQQIFVELKTDYLQLHGNYYHTLESMSEIPRNRIIAAVDGRMSNALDLAAELSCIFQSVLVDTAGAGGLGGTGIAHDWKYSRKIRDIIYPKPLILAGGLTPRNVGDAIRAVEPFGVDVSSGVERRPGVKDREKIYEFIAKAKEAKP